MQQFDVNKRFHLVARRRDLWTLPEFVFYGHDVNTNLGYCIALDEISKAR